MMKRFTWILALAFLSTLAIGVQTSFTQAPAPAPGQPPAGAPAWAFPTPDAVQPPAKAESEVKVPGSDKTMTSAQVDDLFNAADWFPNENTPRPEIITKGRPPAALACGSCHLMSGMGHPESSTLAGLPEQYIIDQMGDFKSGVRKDYARMNGIAGATTPEEWAAAAKWFSSLKPIPWYKVEEADMVPKTYVSSPGRMRLPDPNGGMEPIGNRIIVVPQDTARAMARDPKIGFIAYVPPGSIKKGETLATTGDNGKTIACSICHGAGLMGVGNTPRLAGAHPTYLARQLYLFKSGMSNGGAAALMKPVVANMSDEDILNLAAYIASLPQN
jgi:cytochrome c553